jgi:hypothetical protein
VQQQPFIGFDGVPMMDLAEFAQVLDWVLLMNYDTWGGALFLPGFNVLVTNSSTFSVGETGTKRSILQRVP